MEKLLFITSRVPFPLVGGDKIRVFNSLKTLSRKFDIDLLYIDIEPIPSETEYELSKYCNLIKPFVVSSYSFLMNTFVGLLTNRKPLQVNYYYFRKIQRWIDGNIGEYAAVYCNHIRTTEYVRKHSIPKFVDLVDSIAMNYVKAYENASGLWKLIYGIDKKRVKEYERAIVKEFDKSILISNIDRQFVDFENKHKIKVIGNYVSNIEFDKTINPDPNKICFLGKMNYEPNVNAVLHFVKNIFPSLKNERSNLEFVIIGAQPVKKILELGDLSGVSVTGFVDNPYNNIQSCSLFVAPMISGAGVQNKILEAMKMGKCVVTTKIGSEGLTDLKGDELIICKNNHEMINQITNLLSNQDKLRLIGENAKNYIDCNFSEQGISKQLIDYISD